MATASRRVRVQTRSSTTRRTLTLCAPAPASCVLVYLGPRKKVLGRLSCRKFSSFFPESSMCAAVGLHPRPQPRLGCFRPTTNGACGVRPDGVGHTPLALSLFGLLWLLYTCEDGASIPAKAPRTMCCCVNEALYFSADAHSGIWCRVTLMRVAGSGATAYRPGRPISSSQRTRNNPERRRRVLRPGTANASHPSDLVLAFGHL